MPKRNTAVTTYAEERKIVSPAKLEQIDIRVGKDYRLLSYDKRRRFDRIVESLARKLNLALNQCPLEMIMMRQIAMLIIRISQAEVDIIEGVVEKYNSNAEKWILLARKELRDSINCLSSITQVTERKEKASTFGGLRDVLREKEGLPKSERTEMVKDGHQRRHFGGGDGVTRTKK